jgi:hypothetical protein
MVGCFDQAFSIMISLRLWFAQRVWRSDNNNNTLTNLTRTHKSFFLKQLAKARRINEKDGSRTLQVVQ